MSRGIIIFGAPGSGQTTIGKALAQDINAQHLDLDDYHWRWDTAIPYTVFRSAEERTQHLLADVSKHPYFVMSGNMWSIRKSFEHLFDLAAFVAVPAEVRAERIRNRELKRWGSRILPGGDMYEANAIYSQDYLERVNEYENDQAQQHKQWIKELPCPVVYIDGMAPIKESVATIRAAMAVDSDT